jgi:hypothetical protein
MPRTSSASAISERWQRHGTASAHISAILSFLPKAMTSSSAAVNCGICM